MPGGTLQLSSFGPKNIYFNGNPQLTFFKSVYKRHTNFSIEQIEIDSKNKLSFGGKTSYDIGADGDLLINLYLCAIINLSNESLQKYIYNFGNNIIKSYNIQIGNRIIDKQPGIWLQVWDELTNHNEVGTYGTYPNGEKNTDTTTDINTKMGFYTNNQHTKGLGFQIYKNYDNNIFNRGNSFFYNNNNLKSVLYLDFPLWFCKNTGLGLPISVIDDKIQFYLELNNINNFIDIQNYKNTSIIDTTSIHINNLGLTSTINNTVTDNSEFKLFGEFVFLEENEKRLLRNKDYEYLIEQTQHRLYTLDSNNNSIVNTTLKLDFEYCVKEFIWCFQRKNPLYESELLSPADHNGKISIYLNDSLRTNEENILYYTKYQPYKYHTGRGGVNSPDSIYVYSFALFPEKYEPSGVCNLSVLDKVELKLENVQLATDNEDHTEGVNIHVFALGYNIIEIRNGRVDILFKSII